VPVCGGIKNGHVNAATVCCPRCWMWTELRKSAKCPNCGTPLIYPDGSRVDGMSAAPPSPPSLATPTTTVPPAPPGTPPPPPPPQFGTAAFAGAPLSGGSYFSLTARRGGVDWIGVARWVTMGYGLLVIVVLLVIALAVRHLDLPVTDPSTGRTVVQSIDVGPAFVVAALFAAALFALFAWLMQFTVARGVALFLVGVGALGALARMTEGSVPVMAGALGSLLIDIGFGFVLAMSLFARPASAY